MEGSGGGQQVHTTCLHASPFMQGASGGFWWQRGTVEKGGFNIRFWTSVEGWVLHLYLYGFLVTPSKELSSLFHMSLKFPSTMLNRIGAFINVSILCIHSAKPHGPPGCANSVLGAADKAAPLRMAELCCRLRWSSQELGGGAYIRCCHVHGGPVHRRHERAGMVWWWWRKADC